MPDAPIPALLAAADLAVSKAWAAVQEVAEHVEGTAAVLSRVTLETWRVRALAAEREVSRLRTQAAGEPAPEGPSEPVAGPGTREYGLQYWDELADRWIPCVVEHEARQSAAAIAGVMEWCRDRVAGEEYRATVRDLPPYRPLTDAELDRAVIAEAASAAH